MNKKLKVICILFILFIKGLHCHKQMIMKSHLSNNWYPQEKIKLKSEIKFYLDKAQKKFKVKNNQGDIKIIIAPHAGFYYSGLCAASAYQTLLEHSEKTINNIKKNKQIKNVIILSPSHTKYFEGVATPSFDTYQTILGDINVNTIKIKKLKKNKNIKQVKDIFTKEHAVEIQLPFLQETIEDFKIIPLIVGAIKDNDYKNIANSLKGIVDENTLIIISSDFLHYGKDFNYTPFNKFILDSIRYLDSEALYAIGKKSFNDFNKLLNKTGATICGQNAIKIILKMLEQTEFKDLEQKLTCYYTSAQMTKARDMNEINITKLLSDLPDRDVKNSVSYAGLIFTSNKISKSFNIDEELTGFEKKSLLNLAQRSIINEFKSNKTLNVKDKTPEHLLFPIKSLGLTQKKGAFVTLHKNGNLRGCIGRITSNQELFKTVSEMAKYAAFKDNRFKPVTTDELDQIDIEISVLTKPNKIENYKQIKLGKDGIILKKLTENNKLISSVFLPEVPIGQGWTIEQTLEQLSLKAGLNKNAWKKNAQLEIFQCLKIKKH